MLTRVLILVVALMLYSIDLAVIGLPFDILVFIYGQL